MAYTKQTWANGSPGGTPLSAARLAHMEDGIEAAASSADGALVPAGVIAGANITVDTTSVPGSVVITAAGASDPSGAVYAVPANYSGIDPTGATSSAAGSAAAVADVPDGGTLVIPPGEYLIAARTTITDKSITVWAYGARFVVSSTSTSRGAAFLFEQTYGSMQAVSSVTEAITTDGRYGNNSENMWVTKLTFTSTPSGISVDDYIKVVSDDLVPWATGNVRSGQFCRVIEISGNDVYVSGELIDTFSTNVRVSRPTTGVMGPHKVRWYGGTFTHSAARIAGGTLLGSVLCFNGMIEPEFSDITFVTISGPAIEPRRCFRWRGDNLTFRHLIDNPGIYGYGINDSSEEGCATRIFGERVRHAYTSGAGTVTAGDTDPRNYGHTRGASIGPGTVFGSTQFAWDTHGDAYGVRFHDVQAVDCYGGIQMRGVRNFATNVALRGGCNGNGIWISTQSSSVDSYGTIVDGVIADTIKGNVFVASSSSGTEVRPVWARNIVVRGQNTTYNVLRADAATIVHDGVIVESTTNAKAAVNSGTITLATTLT